MVVVSSEVILGGITGIQEKRIAELTIPKDLLGKVLNGDFSLKFIIQR